MWDTKLKAARRTAWLFRCERRDDFVEASVAAERIPHGIQSELTVSQMPGNGSTPLKFFEREIFVAAPSIDSGKVSPQDGSIDRIFAQGKKFHRTLSFL